MSSKRLWHFIQAIIVLIWGGYSSGYYVHPELIPMYLGMFYLLTREE